MLSSVLEALRNLKFEGRNDYEVTQKELLFFEARCKNVALTCWSFLFLSPAVSQRPTLAVRGEVVTMTASSQDSMPSSMAGLFLLLLLPNIFMQNFAVPTTPTPLLFDLLTQQECTKKEHPKVSIQGQTSFITTCFMYLRMSYFYTFTWTQDNHFTATRILIGY